MRSEAHLLAVNLTGDTRDAEDKKKKKCTSFLGPLLQENGAAQESLPLHLKSPVFLGGKRGDETEALI